MTKHAKFKFGVTLHSDDIGVVYCLRALTDLSQKGGDNKIAWGGTSRDAWAANSHQVTFRFTTPEFRDRMLSEAERLLPGWWNIVRKSDEDPARPQR